jgi:amino acid transporter
LAAGVDHLLPDCFARIHPRWATPHISILLLGGVASALLLLNQVGDTLRSAYETLVSLMLLGGFIPYIYVFSSAWKARCRWSAICGLGVTALAIVASLIPGPGVSSVWLFESKLALGTIGMVVSARLLYRRAAARG